VTFLPVSHLQREGHPPAGYLHYLGGRPKGVLRGDGSVSGKGREGNGRRERERDGSIRDGGSNLHCAVLCCAVLCRAKL
jgi:hypothetical protein